MLPLAFCNAARTDLKSGEAYCSRMSRKRFQPTYIRKWRMARGLTLRELASRLEAEPGEDLISHASLQRIETGQQPYSQPILEAVAAALDVSTSMLLESDPTVEGHVLDLLRHMKPAQRKQAEAIIEALAKAS